MWNTEPLGKKCKYQNKNVSDARGRGSFRGKVAAIADAAALLPLRFLYAGLLCSAFVGFLFDIFQA